MYGFVCEGAGPAHDADAARPVNVAGHDADPARSRGDDTRAVWPDQPYGSPGQISLGAHHVGNRYALGYADNDRDAGGCRLHDGIGRKRRRHVDDGGICPGCINGGGNRAKYRQGHVVAIGAVGNPRAVRFAFELLDLASPAGVDGGDHVGPVSDGLIGVEPARLAQPLNDHLGLLPDENAHSSPPASSTILAAPSFMSAAAVPLSPESAKILLPCSTLVPSSRTTRGTFKPTSLTAATTPVPIVSQRMMPPKMLTKIPRTFGSFVMILKARS